MPRTMPQAEVAENSAVSARRRVIGRPFVRGQSGNPGGRPKHHSFTDLYRAILDSPEGERLVLDALRKILSRGGVAAVMLLREMANRTEGKVREHVEMAGRVGVTLEQIIEARRRAERAG